MATFTGVSCFTRNSHSAKRRILRSSTASSSPGHAGAQPAIQPSSMGAASSVPATERRKKATASSPSPGFSSRVRPITSSGAWPTQSTSYRVWSARARARRRWCFIVDGLAKHPEGAAGSRWAQPAGAPKSTSSMWTSIRLTGIPTVSSTARETSACTRWATSRAFDSRARIRWSSSSTAESLTSTRMPSLIPRRKSRLKPPGTGARRATPGTPRTVRRVIVSRTVGAIVVRAVSDVSGDGLRFIDSPRPSGHRHAAIDREHVSGDVGGVVRCQKDHRPGDVVDRAFAAQRDHPQQRLLGFGRHAAPNLGLDEPGGDGVDGDVAGCDLARQRTGETDLAGFGGRVVRLPGVADLPGDGSDVDNPTVAAPDHVTHGGLGAGEGGLEVGSQDVVPVGLRHRQDQTVAGDPGIVNQNVEVAFALDGGLDQRFGLGEIPDVGLASGRLPTGGGDLRHDLLRGVGAWVVVDHYPRALGRQGEGCGPSNPSRGSRDDGDLAAQTHDNLGTASGLYPHALGRRAHALRYHPEPGEGPRADTSLSLGPELRSGKEVPLTRSPALSGAPRRRRGAKSKRARGPHEVRPAVEASKRARFRPFDITPSLARDCALT